MEVGSRMMKEIYFYKTNSISMIQNFLPLASRFLPPALSTILTNLNPLSF
jgi:hypothetical protein